MKNYLLLTILIFFSCIYSNIAQNKEISKLKTNLKTDAAKTIILGDSILQNMNLSKQEIAIVKYYQATAHQNNKNHTKALQLFKVSLPILKNLNNKKLYILGLLSQSNSNVYFNNLTSATEEAIEALFLAKKNNLNDLIASANTALSFIYYRNGDYLKALDYLTSSEQIFIKEKKERELSGLYNNMAILYKKMGDFDKAIQLNKKSLAISIKTKHYLGIGKSYSNIGRIYAVLGNYNKALKFYQKAVKTNTEHHISNSTPYNNISEAYILLKKYTLAEEFLNKSLKIELKNKNNNELKKIYTDLLKIAVMNKSFDKVLTYQKEIELLNKKIASHDNEEKIKMIENQHLLSQKQQELINAKNKSKNQLIFFTTLTVLLLFLGLFLFQRNKNNKLKIEKEKLILEQRVLRSQMNPHFIFNALSAIQNSLLDNEPIKSASYLSRFAKLIRQNFDFINEKEISLTDEIDALKNYLDTQKMRFQNKFDYEINIFDDVEVSTTKVPPLLLQPFVENAIEHGFKNKQKKGEIIINIFHQQKAICFEIKDNGKGFKNNTKKSKRLHAIDVFKKRLYLLGKNDEKSFKINTSEKGTIINFCLKK